MVDIGTAALWALDASAARAKHSGSVPAHPRIYLVSLSRSLSLHQHVCVCVRARKKPSRQTGIYR